MQLITYGVVQFDDLTNAVVVSTHENESCRSGLIKIDVFKPSVDLCCIIHIIHDLIDGSCFVLHVYYLIQEVEVHGYQVYLLGVETSHSFEPLL